MKKSILLFICSLFALISFSPSFAASNSYNTEVPIASKGDADRAKAFVEAYKQVIFSLSKDPKIMSSPEIKSKLKHINFWVQSYNYTKHSGADGQPSLFLKVNFDPQGIPERLRPTDLADTSDESESIDNTAATTSTDNETETANTANIKNADILVWLATIGDNAKTNVIVDDTNTHPIANPLENIAQKDGFSLTLPTMDLQDITKITADDVCDQDINVIKNSSNRYGATKIAAGCIVQTDSGKRGQWLLLSEDKIYHWDFSGQNETVILQQAFDSMAKVLMLKKAIKPAQPTPTETNPVIASSAKPQPITAPAAMTTTATTTTATTTTTVQQPIPIQKNTVSNIADNEPSSEPTTSPNQVILYVNNISNLDQYADTVKYLRTVPGVSKVELLNISLSTIKLKVSINGGKNALANNLNTQRKLTPNNTSSPENNSVLNYNNTIINH